MNEKELQAISERAEAATPGPWENIRTIGGCNALISSRFAIAEMGRKYPGNRHADVEFLAHARADVPALVAEVRKLRAQVETAHEIVIAGIQIMTPGQIGRWRGVRSFLEQDTDDYLVDGDA